MCSAFQRAHGNGTRPEPFPPGTAKRVPAPSPAWPGLSRVTAWCHRLICVPRQRCCAHRDTHGTGATRTSPGKSFLTLAWTKHIPDLSCSPPRLLVFPPCPQTAQEITAITAININPHLCRRMTKLIVLGAFPGFFRAWSGVSGRTSEGYFLTKPPQHLWLVGWEQPGNEVTLTLGEVNRAETPKPNQGIFSRVGMMQPCCCGDFPRFPGKLNCAFPWQDENLAPTTDTAGPQHRDTRPGTPPT